MGKIMKHIRWFSEEVQSDSVARSLAVSAQDARMMEKSIESAYIVIVLL